jgi:hypothetical protein
MTTPVRIAENGKMMCHKATLAVAVAITDFSINRQVKSLIYQGLLRADSYLQTAFCIKLLNSCKYPVQI